ncbi:MAG: ABC transporter ATP-binding protein [Alphaproteobacteria bacterium]|nr:ABC transporter ATP-binding protein [Alphaproteobacteria bacterium]
MENTENAISVTGLRKVFGDVVAVDGIDFAVRKGSITALLGGNGAGKTTTMAMLLGLLLPTSGTVTVLGHDMLRDRFAVLPYMNFSSPYVDMPGRLTVRQNLIVYGNLYGLDRLKDRIDALGKGLQLGDLLGRQHTTLSAGQKTRASLAKALLNRPRLLLMDEPTASLDPDTADWVRTLLMDYQRTTGATLFMASHNMYEVERMCDDVIMLRQGRIADRGSPRHLLESYERANLEEVFLDITRDRND